MRVNSVARPGLEGHSWFEATEPGEHDALGEQLARDPSVARAQRLTHCEFLLPASGLREQQIRDVGTGDQQNQADTDGHLDAVASFGLGRVGFGLVPDNALARAFRDAGFEIIYTGLHQTPEMVVQTAIQEDVDAVSLSILSGAHNYLFPRVIELLAEQDAQDIAVLIDLRGVAIRAGHHCTMPLHEHLGISASCRASFYLYNTLDEVQQLADGLRGILQVFHRRKRS